jgi:hypothetical protein
MSASLSCFGAGAAEGFVADAGNDATVDAVTNSLTAAGSIFQRFPIFAARKRRRPVAVLIPVTIHEFTIT